MDVGHGAFRTYVFGTPLRDNVINYVLYIGYKHTLDNVVLTNAMHRTRIIDNRVTGPCIFDLQQTITNIFTLQNNELISDSKFCFLELNSFFITI